MLSSILQSQRESIPNYEEYILFLNEEMKCVYCHQAFKRGNCYGRLNCKMHTGHIHYRDNTYRHKYWTCCPDKPYDSEGCMACDHSEIHFSPKRKNPSDEWTIFPALFIKDKLINPMKENITLHKSVEYEVDEKGRPKITTDELEKRQKIMQTDYSKSTYKIKRY